MFADAIVRVLALSLLITAAARTGGAGTECVIHEWAVPPGVWTGSGDKDPTPLLMTETTRWEFELAGCSLALGTCDTFGSGSRTHQNGAERTEWYPTDTEPTITNPSGNTVVFDFSMRDAFVPIMGQPRFEDMDWTLTAELPATPSDSPSAAELAAATSLSVSITHWVDNTFFVISWSGGATDTVFTSCTPEVAQLSVDDVTQAEGTGGPGSLEFTLSRSHNDDAVSVFVATASGTATSGDDFTGLGPTEVLFGAGGALSQAVSVTVGGDSVVELDESFTLKLSNPTNATILDGEGTATLTNDDGATLSIDSGSQFEGSGGGTVPYVFTVTLDNLVDASVTVDFDTLDGTAEDESGDGDYLSTLGTLQFDGVGGSTESIVVSVVADSRPEQDESFLVNLSNLDASGRNVVLGPTPGTATLIDDDLACPAHTIYAQPFDSPAERSGHPATIGAEVTFENVVDGTGAVTTLPPGPVTGLRIWGFGDSAAGDCPLDPGIPFRVAFAADAAGAPGATVAERSNVPGDLAPAGAGVSRIDLDFAAVEGTGVSWISVQRAAVDGCAFVWLAEPLEATYDDQVFTPPGPAPDDAYFCVGDILLFLDGFESGDTSAWDTTVP